MVSLRVGGEDAFERLRAEADGLTAAQRARVRLALAQPPPAWTPSRLAEALVLTSWTLGAEAARRLPVAPLLDDGARDARPDGRPRGRARGDRPGHGARRRLHAPPRSRGPRWPRRCRSRGRDGHVAGAGRTADGARGEARRHPRARAARRPARGGAAHARQPCPPACGRRCRRSRRGHHGRRVRRAGCRSTAASPSSELNRVVTDDGRHCAPGARRAGRAAAPRRRAAGRPGPQRAAPAVRGGGRVAGCPAGGGRVAVRRPAGRPDAGRGW